MPLSITISESLSVSYISELGVLSWRLDADNYETDPELKKIRESRGYSYVVCYLTQIMICEKYIKHCLFLFSVGNFFVIPFIVMHTIMDFPSPSGLL